MSNDDTRPHDSSKQPNKDDRAIAPAAASQKRSIFSIPAPVKRVFDKFPLLTYTENELPLRAPRIGDDNVLYVFTTEEDAKYGRPSFNPACLKWQTYLKICGISFTTVPSSNHASPSGALPFLLPSPASSATAGPVPSNRIKKWMGSQNTAMKAQEPTDMCYDAYASLLDNCVRKAWLYQLYLTPANSPVIHRLYIDACSSNPIVQATIAYQLRRAAETEVVKASASSSIVEADLLREVDEALSALSTLLGKDKWFFGLSTPSLFDASVFAYTNPISNETLGWRENRLTPRLERHENLVQHQRRIMELYY